LTPHMEKCHAWQKFDSIFKKKTWELRDLPPSKKPITTKWVYKTKLTIDRNVEKLKICFIMQGFEYKKRCGFWRKNCTYDEVAYNSHNCSSGITKCMTNQTSRH
jgi:hypothetical protein